MWLLNNVAWGGVVTSVAEMGDGGSQRVTILVDPPLSISIEMCTDENGIHRQDVSYPSLFSRLEPGIIRDEASVVGRRGVVSFGRNSLGTPSIWALVHTRVLDGNAIVALGCMRAALSVQVQVYSDY